MVRETVLFVASEPYSKFRTVQVGAAVFGAYGRHTLRHEIPPWSGPIIGRIAAVQFAVSFNARRLCAGELTSIEIMGGPVMVVAGEGRA